MDWLGFDFTAAAVSAVLFSAFVAGIVAGGIGVALSSAIGRRG